MGGGECARVMDGRPKWMKEIVNDGGKVTKVLAILISARASEL